MLPDSTSKESDEELAQRDKEHQEIANRLLAEGPSQPDPKDLELFPNPRRVPPETSPLKLPHPWYQKPPQK